MSRLYSERTGLLGLATALPTTAAGLHHVALADTPPVTVSRLTSSQYVGKIAKSSITFGYRILKYREHV